MSTSPPAATPTMPPATVSGSKEKEIRIVSHSNLFYWWPVWAVGFLMALLTMFDGQRMALVPSKTSASRTITVVVGENKTEMREGLLVPKDARLIPSKPKDNPPDPEQPHLWMAQSQSLGVVYAIVLLLVIVITNVPLRGLWSVIVIVVIFLSTIIFWLADWWDPIFKFFGQLSIHINAGGYVFISLVLFGAWLLTFLLFDQQIYMIFTPGQLRVRTEIGGGEIAYDTQGMTVQKQRSDLFRHWILGLGSGDLVVNTSGAQAHHFDLPNVLFIGRKVKQIEDMLREKAVVHG